MHTIFFLLYDIWVCRLLTSCRVKPWFSQTKCPASDSFVLLAVIYSAHCVRWLTKYLTGSVLLISDYVTCLLVQFLIAPHALLHIINTCFCYHRSKKNITGKSPRPAPQLLRNHSLQNDTAFLLCAHCFWPILNKVQRTCTYVKHSFILPHFKLIRHWRKWLYLQTWKTCKSEETPLVINWYTNSGGNRTLQNAYSFNPLKCFMLLSGHLANEYTMKSKNTQDWQKTEVYQVYGEFFGSTI